MAMLFEQLVNGLTVGSVYALVALGYTMVYGILKLINFAHGDLFMLGAYLGLSLAVGFALGGGGGSPILVLVLVVVIVMGMVALAGVAIERVAYRPLRRSGRLAPVVSALGVSIFIQNGAMLVWGTGYKVYPENLVPAMRWEVAGVGITLMQVIILTVSIALMLALYVLIQKTTLGAAIRATAIDHETARLMGINVDHIIRLVFIIGPALGAAAGIMVGLYYRQVNFTMGWAYGLKAFTAAIMGGIGNIPGAMIGGLLLGILEMLGAGYIAASWKDAIAFFILIILLIARPTGLLGERVAEKV